MLILRTDDIDDIVIIGHSMALEVDADDAEELLKDNSNELTTEELEHLQNEQERKLADEIEEKGEIDENVSSALIKEMISK